MLGARLVPQSELVHNRRIEQVLRGDITDRDLLERVIGEYEVDGVFHVGVQAIVGIANRYQLRHSLLELVS